MVLLEELSVQYDDVEKVVCIKLFTDEWKAEYEREALAYALMIHRRVERCIPESLLERVVSLITMEWSL